MGVVLPSCAVGLLQAIAKELPEFLQLLEDMKEKVLAVTEQVKSVKSHVERAEYKKVSHCGCV